MLHLVCDPFKKGSNHRLCKLCSLPRFCTEGQWLTHFSNQSPRTMRKFLGIFFSFFPLLIFGQKSKPIPVNLSIFNEATAIPFTQAFSTPIHPGLQIGTEFNLKSKHSARLFQTTMYIATYRNSNNNLRTKIVIRTIPDSTKLISYLHHGSPNIVCKLNFYYRNKAS